MNTQRYRIVYNRARNCLMAVAETITSQGKSKGETQALRSSSPSPNKRAKNHWLKISFTGVAWASYLLLSPTLYAQIIADPNAPGHQQATVSITANGIPLINIQTPNAQGFSHNVYRQFDVSHKGALFNNSRDSVQTQTGAWVAGNPHLIRSGPANTIYNFVNSDNPSVLRGFMEVAGQSAHVIVANPSGITCDGCGFINAHRSTLSTGPAQLDGSGNLAAYRVTRGTINIVGKGLVNHTVNFTDVLARAIIINAKIHAKHMTAIAGANQIPVNEAARANEVDGAKHLGRPSPIAPDPDHKNPAFAMDVSEIGGIYAKHVYLIGTEAGLGIRTAKGSHFSIGEFRVTQAGDIVHRGEIKTERNAHIHAAGGITNEAGAQIVAGGGLLMRTKASIENKGLLAAKGNVDLIADGVDSTIRTYANSTLLAGVDENDAILNPTSKIRVWATQKAALNGKHTASGDLIINSQTIDLRGSETTATNINLLGLDDQAADNIDTSDAKLTTRNALTARALNRLTTNGATISATDFFLSAYEWFNIGGKLTQTSSNDWLMTFLGNVNNTGTTIKTNARHFSITAANIDNTRSTIDHQGTGNVSFTAHQLQSQYSKITTSNTFKVNADQVIFDHATIEVGQIDLSTRLFSNRSGVLKLIRSTPQLFNISGLFDNTQGTLLSNGNVLFTLGQLNRISLLNTGGTISALGQAGVTLNALGTLDNTSGTLKSRGEFVVNAGEIKNDHGQITSGGPMTLKSLAFYNHNGWVQSDSALDIDTQGHLFSNTHSDAKRGVISLGSLTLKTGEFNNLHGYIFAKRFIQANTGYFNNQHGVFSSLGKLALTSLGLNNTDGHITASQLSIDTQGKLLDNTRGKLLATDALDLKSGKLINENGKIITDGSLDILSLALNNRSGWIQGKSVVIDTQGQKLSNRDTYKKDQKEIASGIISHGALTLKTGAFDNQRGRLSAIGLFEASTAYFDNRYGVMNADMNALFNSLEFNNQHGTVSSLANITFKLQQSALDNSDGVIEATGKLSLIGGQMTNRRGKLFGKQALDIKSLAFDNHSGLIKSDHAITIDTQGQSFINKDSSLEGGIHSGGSLSLKTGEFNNRYGHISAHAAITAYLGLLTNAYGKFTTQGGLQLNASQVNNDHGLIYAVGNVNINVGLGEFNNTYGTVQTQGSLDILSGLFNNDGGTVKSALAMTINTQGQKLINTNSVSGGGMISEDSITLTTGEFDNRKGAISTHKKFSFIGTSFFNQGGTVRALTDAHFQTNTIYNAGGWIRAEQMLSLLLGNGLLDNSAANNLSAGLISARTLSIEAGTLRNIGSNQADQGLRAHTIDLSIHDIDNTRGLIHADYSLMLHGRGHINNTQGKISAGEILRIADAPLSRSRRASHSLTSSARKTQHITNTGGTLYAGKQFTLDTASLTNDGQLRSLGDMQIAIHGDYTHIGHISANGAISFTTDGTFTNRAVFNALTNLTLNAANLDNQLLGELSAGTRLTLNIANLLTNRGLIDAPNALIKAMTINNLGSGRIYGTTLGLAASTINNISETLNGSTQSGTIAARHRLDLGAQTINNKGGALIISLGDMAIGGSLDTNHRATGYADTVNNGSSIIDANGNLVLAAHNLNNTNDPFAMEVKKTGPTSVTYIQPQGSTQKYKLKELAWEEWSRAGRYRVKATGQIFTKWTQYTVDRNEFKSRVIQSDPAKIRAAGTMSLLGTNLINDKSQIIAGGAITGDLANLKNIDAYEQHIIKEAGTAQYSSTKKGWYKRKRVTKRKLDGHQTYAPADIITTKKLSIFKFEPNTASAKTDHTLGKRSDHKPPAVIEVPVLSAAPQVQALNTITLGEQPQFDVTRQALAANPNTAAVANGNAASAPLSAPMPAQAPTQTISAAPREVIRTIEPNIKLPTASLYTVNPSGPDTQPLIETDPRFTNYQQWLGSQALMTAGTVDPNITQKRLSDNFYEQQLIRDQVTQLTGRRFLNGYQNDHDQYQALINHGVSVAHTFQLTPGIALTPAQMARLTTDMVWLVEKPVTLANGTTTKALVPQLYVKVKEGDLNGDGALISGDSVQFRLTGDLDNGATIAGRTLVDISSQNINNHLGRIQAADARLSALLDINNIGGSFEAENSLNMNAGQDINVESTTQSAAQTAGPSSFKRTNLDRVAGLYVGRGGNASSSTAASLIAQAGRDINLIGAAIDNGDERATSQISFTSGRDTHLGTQKIEVEEKLLADANHTHQQSSSQEIGTSLNTQGQVQFQAGRDVNARVANVNSEQGAVQVTAANNVNLVEGQQTQTLDEYHKTSSKGILSSSTKTTRDTLDSSSGIATTFSGKSTSVTAGNDINLKGSNVVSDQGTDLTAGNNVNVQAGQNIHRETHFAEEKKSGLMGSGGIGFTIGSKQQSKDAKLTETTSNASTVGATDGNVNINAGKTYTQVGSDLIALSSDNAADNTTGDIHVNAQQIDVLAAENTASQRVEEKFKQSGLTIGITSPVITAIQTAEQMRQAKNKTQNGRMKQLADMATAAAAYNAGAAVAANKDQAGGVNISVSVGTSQNQSVSTQTATTLTSSQVKAAKDITFNATGAGEDSDINIVASHIKAGEDASFKADNDINFLAGQNTSEHRSKNKSSSASVGVSFGTDGFLVNISGSGARGKANGNDTTHTHTEVEAGQTLTVESGRDTNLKGATATGKHITANSGRDLNIESVQDSSTYNSKQQNIGGSLSVGYGKMSGSFSAGQSKVNSDYQSVTQQSGFKAGDEGFDINVQGNTDLKGGLIASTDKAAEDNKNKLETGTLTTSDLHNKAEYEASSLSVGVGTSPGMGITPAGMGWGNDSDSQASTTKAGISQANIKITDEEKQKELTGKDAEQTVADLNRDVSSDKDASGALQNKFDAAKVQDEIDAQTAITQTFGQQAAQAVGIFAQKKAQEYKDQSTALRKQIAENSNLSSEEREALRIQAQQHTDEAEKWDEGGRYRVAMHTVAGGLTGNIAGAVSATAVASSAQKLNELQGHIAQSLKDAGASDNVASIASQLIAQTAVAGAGAAVGAATGNTTAGAAIGLNIDSNNRQLHPTETQWIKNNAKYYADRKGINEVDAEKQLAQQAQRQVQFGVQGQWDAEASGFLSTAGKQLLPTDPAFANSGPGYMFYATPEQKANSQMYATQSPQHTQFAQKNDLKTQTTQQVQQAQNRDSNIRDNVKTATTVAAAAAVAATIPPALSWCLSNPVACNRIAVSGGEIAAGDALGPAGLGVIGTASAVKAVRSADEVNAAMKAKGWQPAWSPATPVIETTLQPGTKVNMIVDAKTAEAITKHRMHEVTPGGWATFDDVNSIAVDMRQKAAITKEFKKTSDGPFYVVEMEITQPVKSNIGFVGKQTDTTGGLLRGGGTQVQFDETIKSRDRQNFLKPTSIPQQLN